MSENNVEHKTWWEKYGWLIILVFSVLVLLFFLFQSLSERSTETEQESKKRVDQLRRRQRKLKGLVQKKKNHKRWLDWFFRIVHVVSRVFILGIGALGFYSANCWYTGQNVSIEQYLTWGAVLAICFSSLTFLIYGSPLTILKVLQELKPKLENLIYGKYLGIDQTIKLQEKEIIEIEKEIQD